MSATRVVGLDTFCIPTNPYSEAMVRGRQHQYHHGGSFSPAIDFIFDVPVPAAMQPLCFGGSFNPIHHGHLIGARAVAEQLGATRVMIVPSGKPPHKQDRNELAPAADRAQMCRLAVMGEPLFDVNDIEVQLPGPSYTLDTVRELHRLGYGRVRWLIGADMLMYLPQWHRADDLINEVDFVVMARPGWDLEWNRLPAAFRHLRQSVVEAPRVDISSTDIRRRVAEGASIQYLTPPVVAQYIHDRGLYR